MKKIIGYEKEQKVLKEVGDMLTDVKKYRELGIRIPRGLVLYGEPGVGKSVMARSLANCGANVIELRAAECCLDGAEENIRKVFDKAKKNAPSVLILDELDKIAGISQRFFMPTNSDVNKVLLQEIDSLSDDDYVLVVATCNDTECLGDALLRSGRFDRQIKIQLPDQETRKAILEYYFSKVKLGKNIDVEYIAKITHGRSGADLECIVNEAAIEVFSKAKKIITLKDVRAVINKMTFDGLPENPTRDKDHLYKIAIHEAGHALVAMKLLPDNIHAASVIPQGDSSGHIEFIRAEGEVKSVNDYQSEIAVALAGRVAEREKLNEIYLGSRSDLHRAMSIATELVTKHGVSGYKHVIQQIVRYNEGALSDRGKYESELEIEKLLVRADEQANKIITENYGKFDIIVGLLMEKQVLSREELFEILNSDANNKQLKVS